MNRRPDWTPRANRTAHNDSRSWQPAKPVLVSSHILTELAEMCDQVGIIEQGALLAVGTVDEIQRGETRCCEVRVRVL